MTDQRDQRPEQGERQQRQDLAAMLHPLTRALVAAELPVLARHGISMWGYVVLNALEHGPARTQAALAQSIGADKTRIITTLDELQQAGLISREPDPGTLMVRFSGASFPSSVSFTCLHSRTSGPQRRGSSAPPLTFFSM